MATYVVGTRKTRLNETFLLSNQISKLRSGQEGLIFFVKAARITYAEDRAQMNRELNYLFNAKCKLDIWRGRSVTAARCGHGFHNRSSLTPASDV